MRNNKGRTVIADWVGGVLHMFSFQKQRDYFYGQIAFCQPFHGIFKIQNEWFTCRERKECSSLHKLSLSVEEVSWVEGVRSLPFSLVKQHRGQHGHQGCALNTAKSPRITPRYSAKTQLRTDVTNS